MSAHLVRVIGGRIAELDTGSPECTVPLPDELVGQHLDSLLYVDGQFIEDEGWEAPTRPPAGFGDEP